MPCPSAPPAPSPPALLEAGGGRNQEGREQRKERVGGRRGMRGRARWNDSREDNESTCIYHKEEGLDFAAKLATALPVSVEQLVSRDPGAGHPLPAC